MSNIILSIIYKYLLLKELKKEFFGITLKVCIVSRVVVKIVTRYAKEGVFKDLEMPFTPYHFGPHGCVGLVFKRYLDLPVFLLANVAVDLEPLAVMVFGLSYPLHGYFHTFLFGTFVGIGWAWVAYPFRDVIKLVMNAFRLRYSTTLIKMIVSGVLGAWLHVLFDAPLYRDIRPFFPWEANPLYDIVSMSAVYRFCAICFISAIVLYVLVARNYKTTKIAKS